MASHEDSEEEWSGYESTEDVGSRIDDLESRLDELERDAPASGGDGCAPAGYGLGATLAMILSWQSNHAVLWVVLHGLLSWVYVIYYLIVNWDAVKLT